MTVNVPDSYNVRMDAISRPELRHYSKDEYVEDELNKLDVSSDDCDSEEEECVDILSNSPGLDDSDQSRTEEDTGHHNNFSIDRILGIEKRRKNERKDEKCVRPTPLPIMPRASELPEKAV